MNHEGCTFLISEASCAAVISVSARNLAVLKRKNLHGKGGREKAQCDQLESRKMMRTGTDLREWMCRVRISCETAGFERGLGVVETMGEGEEAIVDNIRPNGENPQQQRV